MAIPTDDEICDAVQEAGAYGMTIGDLGKRLVRQVEETDKWTTWETV